MPSKVLIHPMARPADELLFAPTRDRYGIRLALVFGNHAPGGQCPHYTAGNCRHCDIGAGEGVAFTAEMNRRRLEWFQVYYGQILPEVRHLLLYNSGSILNPQEMPVNVLDEILAWTRTLPALRVVSLETREGLATQSAVRRVADGIGAGRTVRVVVGLETSDDRLRNEVLAKRMARAAVNRLVEMIRCVAGDLGRERIGLTFNILVGGPGTTSETAVDDAVGTARYALEIGREANISVDLNLHPYYRSERGRSHFPNHPRCSPETVSQVASAVAELAGRYDPPSVLFIGTNDEGHDRGSDPPDWRADAVRAALESFNQGGLA